MVTELNSIPDDVSTVTCSLVPEALVKEMKEDQSQLSLCILGNEGCNRVPGLLIT